MSVEGREGIDGVVDYINLLGVVPGLNSVSPDVVARVANSPAFTDLQGKPRYDIWKPDDISDSEWIAALDCDFDNAHHLFKTAVINEGICAVEGVNVSVSFAAVLTGLAHDMAEAKTGDTNINLKTDEDDQKDIDLLTEMLVSGELHLTEEELVIVQEVMTDKQNEMPLTPAGRIFDLSELFGYVISGVRTAWDTAHPNQGEVPGHQDLLRFLAVDTVFNSFLRINRYLADPDKVGYKAANLFIEQNHARLQAVMEHFADEIQWQSYLQIGRKLGFGHKQAGRIMARPDIEFALVLRSKSLEITQQARRSRLLGETATTDGAVEVTAVLGDDVTLTAGD